ncbi:MAG: hypothetical protein PHD97_12300 [Bacteroidales bacterium]|nr:hypothetical protein [Bacteroidales bacterium]
MLKRILILFIVLIATLFALEKAYDFFLLKNKDLKTSYVLNDKINADVLVIGSCVPMYMFLPDVFDKYTNLKSYNLSTENTSFSEIFLNFHLYLKNNKPPEYLFINVSYETFDESFNMFNSYRFAHLLGDTVVANVIKNKERFYYNISFIPFMRYAYYNSKINFYAVQGAKHFLFNKKFPYNKNGRIKPVDMGWNFKNEKFIKQNPEGYYYSFSEIEYGYLNRIIQIAKKNRIRVMLFEAPVYKVFRPYIKNKYEISRYISTLAAKNNLQYWNFDTMKIADNEKYFLSLINTKEVGSVIFTETLAGYFNAYKNINRK